MMGTSFCSQHEHLGGVVSHDCVMLGLKFVYMHSF